MAKAIHSMIRVLDEARAAAADFDFGGMWVEKDSWTPATTRMIRKAARDAGVELLDCEVAWIMPGAPDP